MYFHDYKFVLEIDENGHIDRNIDYEEAKEQEPGCKLIIIDPHKEEFDIFRAVNAIFRHIKQSTKKTLINKISMRLLRLEFNPNLGWWGVTPPPPPVCFPLITQKH